MAGGTRGHVPRALFFVVGGGGANGPSEQFLS